MDSKQHEGVSPRNGKGDKHKASAACAPCADAPHAIEDAGRAKGAAIGGAIGHAATVAKDAVVGAVASAAAAGKRAVGALTAAPLNPTAEHEYWRKEHLSRPYFTQGTPYEQYGPAFQYGWQSFATSHGKTFNDVEPQLARDWESHRGLSKLNWSMVKGATHDAWQRAEKTACDVACG